MELIIENLEEKNLSSFKSCFDANNDFKEEIHLKWQYLETPIHKKYIDIAIDEETDKVAAIYAVFPVHFKIGEEKEIACQSLDTITDVDYRGKGLFINLAKDVYQKAADDGVKLVYGFPNGNSIHGFSKKLDWSVLDPVPFLIKPLNSSYFTKRIKPLKWLPNIKLAFTRRINNNIIIESKKEFPIEVNKIWGQFSKDILVGIHRDKVYLDWRYIAKPNEDYQILHAYTSKKEYVGFLVYCIKEKHGGKVAYIMEYMYHPKFENEASALLKHASNDCIAQNVDCILSWCMEHSPNYQHYKKLKFIKMPEKLKPIELHFGTRAFDENLKEIITNRKNWYISYSDSDTV